MTGTWKVSLDQGACISSGICQALAPGRFRVKAGSPAEVVSEEVDGEDALLDAAESCPVEAIGLVDVASGGVVYPPAD
ncbi:ferredoxin [Saccharothrix sp. Mg75]|uniref:ferredoxin n=1 Tax=Saccharothrix sp. Mg75 TaxID=3445357 RepID=UPI003EEE4604